MTQKCGWLFIPARRESGWVAKARPESKSEGQSWSERAGFRVGFVRLKDAKSGSRFESWSREAKGPEGQTESSKKIEKTVDDGNESAKVTLPLITADSQVSEWFCEHRDSECLETVDRSSRGKGWCDGAKRSPSSLTVWFSEFQAAGPKRDGKTFQEKDPQGFWGWSGEPGRGRFSRNIRKRSTEIEAKIELCVIRRVFEVKYNQN